MELKERAKEYAIIVFYSKDDEGWVADVTDLEYCSAFGDSAEEALREVRIALVAWLEVAQAEGVPLPEPTRKPQFARIA